MVSGIAGQPNFRDQYVQHVAEQLTEIPLSSRTGVKQVVLASQDRRGSSLQSVPLSVLVLPPTPEEPLYRVTDNGYVASVVGHELALSDSVEELLIWHVVTVDRETGQLVALVDDPSQVGARIHDLEQAMVDVLREASSSPAPVVDLESAARAAALAHGLTRLTRDRSGRATEFVKDVEQVVTHLLTLLPALTWTVVLVDETGLTKPVFVAGHSYPELYDFSAPWDATVCAAQAKGLGPTAAPDLMAVPGYAAAPVTQLGFEGCYLGSTLRRHDGTVIGALCGLAPTPQPGPEIVAQAQTVEMMALLLSRTWDVYELLSSLSPAS